LTQHTKPQAHFSICCKFETRQLDASAEADHKQKQSMNQQKYRKNSDDLSTKSIALGTPMILGAAQLGSLTCCHVGEDIVGDGDPSVNEAHDPTKGQGVAVL
jgi:hypothetical protein